VTLKGQSRDSDMFGAQYLEIAWRYRLGYIGAGVGNSTWVVGYQMVTCPTTSRDLTAGASGNWRTGGLTEVAHTSDFSSYISLCLNVTKQHATENFSNRIIKPMQ